MRNPSVVQPSWTARLQALDQRLFFQVFRPGAAAPWHTVMRWLTRSADGWLYPILFPLLAFCLPSRGLPLLGAALTAFTLERLCYTQLKARLRRRRPCDLFAHVHHLLPPPDEFSFPSGHTAAATVCAALLASIFPLLAPVFYLWAAGVGFSRVWLGVHFPADAAVGACLGFACAAVGLFSFT